MGAWGEQKGELKWSVVVPMGGAALDLLLPDGSDPWLFFAWEDGPCMYAEAMFHVFPEKQLKIMAYRMANLMLEGLTALLADVSPF
eukprot:1158903-Pelagomonas_calceolata.AAC.23